MDMFMDVCEDNADNLITRQNRSTRKNTLHSEQESLDMPYRRHLRQDPMLRQAVQMNLDFQLKRKKHIHLEPCASIISQQLSTKAAATIHGRFLALFKTKYPGLEDILSKEIIELREIGLSHAKANYVHHVCRYFLEEKLTDQKLYKMTSDEVMHKLIQIKGVGKWTVEMLLIFGLGHEDVFSPGDLVLQQVVASLYKLDISDKKKFNSELLRISDQWKPYRSYACLYLWKYKDNLNKQKSQ